MSIHKQLTLLILFTLAITFARHAASAGDSDEEKVGICVACHGADGIGKANQYPSLQGLPVEYLVAQLRAFRSGARASSTMNVVAKPLSDGDIRLVAEFFNKVQ